MKDFLRRVLAVVTMLGLYFISRLVNLDKLPIFTDEAIYIRWSQIGSADANWRFISLTDGKQPLFTWIMMVYFKLIHVDPLIIGRLVSVTAGFITVTGLWFLAKELFRNSRIATIAVFLYIVMPFGLFYDRMALYDSLVGALYIWSLFMAVLFIRSPTLERALLYAMILAMGMLNKSSGFISLYLTPVTLVISQKEKNHLFKKIWIWLRLFIIAALLSQVYYSVLRLSPFFHMIGRKDTVFVYSISEWIGHPLKFFVGNIKGLFDWLIGYMSWPIFIASIGSFFLRIHLREKILLLLYWLLPFCALAMFGKVLYPRYILFMTLPLLLLIAVSFDWIIGNFRNKSVVFIIFFIILIQSLHTSYIIVTDPIHAPIPQADRGQMIDDWPAGGGIREVNSFLSREAQSKHISIYTDGTFGLLPYAVEMYLVQNPNVKIKGIWPFPPVMPREVSSDAEFIDTYIITNQYQDTPTWPVQLILQYQKGTRPDRWLRLYKIVLPLAFVYP